MIAVDFPERNILIAEDQQQYETLPACVVMKDIDIPNDHGVNLKMQIPWEVTCCFQLNREEIEEVIRTGKIWYTQMIFGKNFQPIRMSTKNPFE